jgi:ATP-dependent protease ClpP protease subunit
MIEIGSFTDDDLAPAQAKFDELVSQGAKTVLFRINSNGGSIRAGLDLIQHLEQFRKSGGRVECVVDYRAYSMGFL